MTSWAVEPRLQGAEIKEAGLCGPAIYKRAGRPGAMVYRWERKFTGLDMGDVAELEQLRQENRESKGVSAELSLDKTILREAL